MINVSIMSFSVDSGYDKQKIKTRDKCYALQPFVKKTFRVATILFNFPIYSHIGRICCESP